MLVDLRVCWCSIFIFRANANLDHFVVWSNIGQVYSIDCYFGSIQFNLIISVLITIFYAGDLQENLNQILTPSGYKHARYDIIIDHMINTTNQSKKKKKENSTRE